MLDCLSRLTGVLDLEKNLDFTITIISEKNGSCYYDSGNGKYLVWDRESISYNNYSKDIRRAICTEFMTESEFVTRLSTFCGKTVHVLWQGYPRFVARLSTFCGKTRHVLFPYMKRFVGVLFQIVFIKSAFYSHVSLLGRVVFFQLLYFGNELGEVAEMLVDRCESYVRHLVHIVQPPQNNFSKIRC